MQDDDEKLPHIERMTSGRRIAVARREAGLCKHARPYLEGLAKSTGCTVALGVLDGGEVLLVDLLPGTDKGQRDRGGDLKVGSSLPTYCTALGKVLLAHLPARRRRALIADIELELHAPPTPHTIPTERLLRAALARIRATGIATNQEEWCPDTLALAAPVRDESGEVIAAVGLSSDDPRVRLDNLLRDHAHALATTAALISALLGYEDAENVD